MCFLFFAPLRKEVDGCIPRLSLKINNQHTLVSLDKLLCFNAIKLCQLHPFLWGVAWKGSGVWKRSRICGP